MHLDCTKLLSNASAALDKECVAFLDLNRHEKNPISGGRVAPVVKTLLEPHENILYLCTVQKVPESSHPQSLFLV